jgi:amino acid transporter
VASVLYALGFAFFTANALERVRLLVPVNLPFSVTSGSSIIFLALLAVIYYSMSLIYKSGGGGQLATWGKVAVFTVIIASGFWYLADKSFSSIQAPLTPFFAGGTKGLFQAMGYTFIALQGFDLIAAVAGEVKTPEKNVPRAMMLSVGIALAIYLPLLFVIATAGILPGQDIVQMSRTSPETVMATAVQNYLGPFGYWLVMLAAILAMLSALRANLLGASRIALTMAQDRTLPRQLERISESRKTPIHATVLTMLMVMIILFMIPDVAKAGAAASLIFMVSFALSHWTAILARLRTGSKNMPFLAPWFPATHVAGASACIGLAIFQGIQVPSAGLIGIVWLGIGGILYLTFFAQRASVVDVSSAAIDPQLQLLRGRNPLVLAPIVNPANAEFMIALATAMAPPDIGRVLLLSVVKPRKDWHPDNPMPQIENIQTILKKALSASVAGGLAPQTLITLSPEPWEEIIRVARIHRCESLVLGLSDLEGENTTVFLEKLMGRVDSDIVVLRAANGLNMSLIKRVLVPVGGHSGHDHLRARILGSLQYMGIDQISFLQILPETTPEKLITRRREWLKRMTEDERINNARIIVERSSRPIDEIIRHAADNDLLILGLQRLGRRHKIIGNVVRQIAEKTSCGLILISRRR